MTLASGASPIFSLVVHQPASPSIWPAVQSLRRGLSTIPGVTNRGKMVKAAGPTGLVIEMMKASCGFSSRWMTDLINNIIEEGCIPDGWRKSTLLPVYKGKSDPLVCGLYRAIKLLEQPMKVLERVGIEDQK